MHYFICASAVVVLSHLECTADPIWMSEVDCDCVDRLEDCHFLGWGRHSCTHREDVGVICKPSKYIYVLISQYVVDSVYLEHCDLVIGY